jgi:hypothetical protein
MVLNFMRSPLVDRLIGSSEYDDILSVSEPILSTQYAPPPSVGHTSTIPAFDRLTCHRQAAGNPPSSLSPLSLSVEYGAQVNGMQQPNPDNLIWFQLIRSDY